MNKYGPKGTPNPGGMSRHVGKHRFITLEYAQQIANKMAAEQGKPFSVYCCIICHGYHIGHTPPQFQGDRV